MDPATMFAISLGTSALVGGASAVLGHDDATKNLAFQKQKLEYDKGLQNTIFAREDNAVQRRAQDLEAAGLSKTLAAGSAAGAGAVVKTTAPQIDRATKINNALSLISQGAQIGQSYAQTKLMEKQGAVAESQIKLNTANMSKALAEAGIKIHDLNILKKGGILSTSSGISKDVLNLFNNANRLPTKKFMGMDSIFGKKSSLKIIPNSVADKVYNKYHKIRYGMESPLR